MCWKRRLGSATAHHLASLAWFPGPLTVLRYLHSCDAPLCRSARTGRRWCGPEARPKSPILRRSTLRCEPCTEFRAAKKQAQGNGTGGGDASAPATVSALKADAAEMLH